MNEILVMATENFTYHELRCKCGQCSSGMVMAFMEKLELIRKDVRFAMPVTSAYRCPDHNDKETKSGRDGPHTTRRAVDVNIWGDQAYQVVHVAQLVGMTGIGVKQHGENKSRFVHLDDLQADLARGRPRPWIWSYP